MNMVKQSYILIAVMIISLSYSIFYLIKGRRVKIICKGSNKALVYMFYAILAGLILFKNPNQLGTISAAVVMISSILYNLVPSGYDDKGIYLRGRFFSYNKITEMNFDYVNDYYQLSFYYRGKGHVLLADKEDKERLKGAYSLYKNIKNNII